MGVAGGLVFISYSHEDQEWQRRLTVVLAPVVREGLLDVWADDHIRIGEQWRRSIDDAVAHARAAVLLVSASFLASRFVMDEELPALRAHGVPLIPVLLRECLWQHVPALADVQWAHDPVRDGPLDVGGAPPGERDRRLTQVCARVVELVATSSGATGSPAPEVAGRPPAGAVPWAPTRPVGPPGSRVAVLDGVPALPPGFVPRPEVEAACQGLLASQRRAVGVTDRAPGHALAGQGGIGKTVVAVAVCRDSRVRSAFPDGVYWVGLGQDADLLPAQRDLLGRLGAAAADVRSVTQAAGLLRTTLADRRLLLVVDDVWSVAAAQAFAVTGPSGRVLCTTRFPALLTATGAAVTEVTALDDAAARTLLAELSGTPEPDLPGPMERVLAGTGRVALALALVASAVRGGEDWGRVADELDRGRHIYGTHPYANTFKALHLAVAALPAATASAYTSLAVLPQDTAVPVSTIARYWGRLLGHSPDRTGEQLAALAERHLVRLSGQAVALHELQHDYVLLQAEDLSLLHADLLAAHRAELTATGEWWQLPAGEPYLWDHLGHHLLGAGDATELVRVVTDPAYVCARVHASGVAAAEADLRRVPAVLRDPTVAWWTRWLAHHGHLLAGLPDLADVAVTMLSLLSGAPTDVDGNRLQPLLPQRYLVPRWPLDVGAHGLVRVLDGHGRPVRSVAFSPDGATLAGAGDDGAVRLWSPATGQQVVELLGHDGAVVAVAFGPDGTTLASAGTDGTVRLWDPRSGTPTGVLSGSTAGVRALAISPDGSTLAGADDDGTVRLWEVGTGARTGELAGRTDWVRTLAFSPDGVLLASGGFDGTVRLWQARTGEPVGELTGHGDTVAALAFSPDGAVLASAGWDGAVRLWDPATRAGTGRLQAAGVVTAVAFGPDGTVLAAAGADRVVRLWDPFTGIESALLQGHTGCVTSVAFSPDGATLASAADDGTVRLWDPTARARVGAPDGPAASRSQRAPESRGLPDTRAQWVRAVALSPDGSVLASAGEDGTVRLRDPVTGAGLRDLAGHAGAATAVAFSPDGSTLASAGDDGTVRLWDPATGTESATLTGRTGAVDAVAFSPDGRTVAGAGFDGTVVLWDAAGRTWTRRLSEHGVVTAVAFSPDGATVATAGWDRAVRLWDPATGTARGSLTGHTGAVTAVAFSPDGALLASAGDDGTVRLWDPATGTATGTLTGHTGAVTAVAFGPDGAVLASAGFDGTVRLWSSDGTAAVGVLRLRTPVRDLCWRGDLLAAACLCDVALLDLVHGP